MQRRASGDPPPSLMDTVDIAIRRAENNDVFDFVATERIIFIISYIYLENFWYYRVAAERQICLPRCESKVLVLEKCEADGCYAFLRHADTLTHVRNRGTEDVQLPSKSFDRTLSQM